MADLREFNRSLREMHRQVERDLAEHVIDLSIRLSEAIVLSTPVKTGRTAASWTLARNEPDPSVQEEDFFGGYNEALEAIRSHHKRLTPLRRNPYQSVWISNNLPHVVFLEYGTDKMQPFGMVRSSIQLVVGEQG